MGFISRSSNAYGSYCLFVFLYCSFVDALFIKYTVTLWLIWNNISKRKLFVNVGKLDGEENKDSIAEHVKELYRFGLNPDNAINLA